MKTIFVKPADVERKWYLIDADGKVLGRFASRVVAILRGKNKPVFAPHWDLGDSVVIINAEKVKVTGRKPAQKMYYRHSGYPGGFRAEPYEKVIARKPAWPLEKAIKGMLPKGALGRKIFKNLKVYAGPNHPHAAQKPVPIDIS
jgi:large subunit ribosomal protein L13